MAVNPSDIVLVKKFAETRFGRVELAVVDVAVIYPTTGEDVALTVVGDVQ